MSYTDILTIAQNAAQNAGKILLDMFHSDLLEIETKEGQNNNLVTSADYAAQNAIIHTIKENFSHHEIMAEETRLSAPLNSPHLWIIDPLDGTNNYANRIPHFSISIAYAEYAEVKVGVILDVTRNELFSATADHDATLNNKQIRVSRKKNLDQSIFATGFYYDRGEMMKKTLKALHILFNKDVRCIRRMGSAALDLAWVACGRYEGYFEYFLNPWDFAAGMLIIKKAGGRCSDRDGKPMMLNTTGTITSNEYLHEQLLSALIYNSINLE